MMFPRLGFQEIVLILVVVLIVFGPRRLPELGGALGKGIREFKRSISDLKSEIAVDDESPNQFNKPRPQVAGTVATGGDTVSQSVGTKEAEAAVKQG